MSNDDRVLPISVEHPILGLAIYEDGLLCTISGCRQIYRSPNSLRVY